MSEIIIIAAVAKNGVIGKDGKLPWNLKDDLERFKQLTLNHTIIMGRKTFESLPIKPLPKRKNIVVSSKPVEGYDNKIFTTDSLTKAIEHAKKSDDKIFLIGGQSIYKEGLKYADSLDLTELKEDYEGDTYFPKFNKNEWNLVKSEDNEKYSFNQYKRK